MSLLKIHKMEVNNIDNLAKDVIKYVFNKITTILGIITALYVLVQPIILLIKGKYVFNLWLDLILYLCFYIYLIRFLKLNYEITKKCNENDNLLSELSEWDKHKDNSKYNKINKYITELMTREYTKNLTKQKEKQLFNDISKEIDTLNNK